jgi:hypothetical protein
MGAAVADQADSPELVTEENQIFAEGAHKTGRLLRGELLGDRDRVPVASEELAGGSARANAGQELVLCRAQHDCISSSEGRIFRR